MRRREFITLLGGAAMWPLTARAQQGERVRRVGVLTGTKPEDAQNKDRNAAFVQALQQLGWTPGRNVRIDYRFSGGDPVTSRKQAEELVALAPDVIVSTGSFSTGNLLRVTHTVPVVFTIVPDPVGSGFVDSLSQPGRNATGFMQFEYGFTGKWLELLKEIAPNLSRAIVPHSRRAEAGRPACNPVNKDRIGDQPQDRQSAWSYHPTLAACARRPGDRVTTIFTAARNVCFWLKPDVNSRADPFQE